MKGFLSALEPGEKIGLSVAWPNPISTLYLGEQLAVFSVINMGL